MDLQERYDAMQSPEFYEESITKDLLCPICGEETESEVFFDIRYQENGSAKCEHCESEFEIKL